MSIQNEFEKISENIDKYNESFGPKPIPQAPIAHPERKCPKCGRVYDMSYSRCVVCEVDLFINKDAESVFTKEQQIMQQNDPMYIFNSLIEKSKERLQLALTVGAMLFAVELLVIVGFIISIINETGWWLPCMLFIAFSFVVGPFIGKFLAGRSSFKPGDACFNECLKQFNEARQLIGEEKFKELALDPNFYNIFRYFINPIEEANRDRIEAVKGVATAAATVVAGLYIGNKIHKFTKNSSRPNIYG